MVLLLAGEQAREGWGPRQPGCCTQTSQGDPGLQLPTANGNQRPLLRLLLSAGSCYQWLRLQWLVSDYLLAGGQ